MTGKPPHDKRLSVSGLSLTKQRPSKHSMRCLIATSSDIEKKLIQCNFFDNAPFHWITVIIRYGKINENMPSYGKISKKYGDLPLSIEIDIQGKRNISYEENYLIYCTAILKSLIHAGQKFNLPVEGLEFELDKIAEL